MLAEFENHDSLKEILKFKPVVISVFVITINQVLNVFCTRSCSTYHFRVFKLF